MLSEMMPPAKKNRNQRLLAAGVFDCSRVSITLMGEGQHYSTMNISQPGNKIDKVVLGIEPRSAESSNKRLMRENRQNPQ